MLHIQITHKYIIIVFDVKTKSVLLAVCKVFTPVSDSRVATGDGVLCFDRIWMLCQ